MDNKRPNSMLLKGMGSLIPFILLFANNKYGAKFKVNIDSSLQKKVDMLDSIIPYFSHKEQTVLFKVQDILDILNKIYRVKSNNYNNEVNNSVEQLSSLDRKERILREIVNYLEGSEKELVTNVLSVKERVDETKSNITSFKTQVNSSQVGKTDNMIKLMKCFNPIMPRKTLSKVEKIEKIMKIIKTPDN